MKKLLAIKNLEIERKLNKHMIKKHVDDEN